jgi:hypothetical protein
LIAHWTRHYIKLAQSIVSGATNIKPAKKTNFKGKIFSKAGRKPFVFFLLVIGGLEFQNIFSSTQ